MSELLDQALEQAFGDGNPEGTVAEPEPTETAGNVEPTGETAEGGPQPAGGEEEDPSIQALLERVRTENPDLAPVAEQIYKEFQRGYTTKFQALAEQRKALEGVDPNTVQVMRQVLELAESDPVAAATWFRQQAEWLARGADTPEEAPDPYGGYEPATQTEEFLLQRVREMDAWRQQLEQQQQAQQAEQAFTRLEAQVGRQLPPDERVQLAQFCLQNGITGPNCLENGWFLLNRDRLIAEVAQKARDEAASVVGQKATAAPAPSLLANRAGGGTPPAPTDLDAIAELAALEAGLK